MTTYTINSECGVMVIEAESIEQAKEAYAKERGYDFDGYKTFEGSWYFVAEDGVRVEDCTENMP